MISTFSVSITLARHFAQEEAIDHTARARAGLEQHERFAGEILRRDLLPLRQRMPGHRHEQEFLAQHGQRDEVGFLDRQRQEARVDVAGADFLDGAACRGDHHADVELRMRAFELLDERRKDVEADGHAARQTQRPFELAGAVGDARDGVADVEKHALAERESGRPPVSSGLCGRRGGTAARRVLLRAAQSDG
jgi:hypothetical protein